jgi:sensor domain CHASE-containing protein
VDNVKLFSGKSRVKEMGIISVVLIITLSFGLFFYINGVTETSVRSNLFEEQKQRQIQSTETIAKNIGSDINLVIFTMEGLADSIDMQGGNFATGDAKDLLESKYDQFSALTNINRLFVVDKNDVVIFSVAPPGFETILGNDLSQRDWVKETRANLKPVIASGYESQGIYRVIMTIPVIDRDSKQYLGLIGTSIPTDQFFSQFGKLNNVSSQSMIVLDGDGTVLEHGEKRNLEGKNFFSEDVQSYINHNGALNNLTKGLLTGVAGQGIYDSGRGERFLAQSPVLVKGEPTLFVQTVTPESSIYSNVEGILFGERVKMLSLIGGTSVAILVLIILLIKWNSTLNVEVHRKAKELVESERRARELEESNENMKIYLEEVMKEVSRFRNQGYE